MKKNNSKLKIYNSALLLLLTSTLLPLASFLLLLTSCDTTNPPGNHTIALAFEDASCTEAWLNLKLASRIMLPKEITLKQNDSTIITTTINSYDTTLFIENLLPNQTYNFCSTIKQLNNGTIKSNKLPVTTMDTTSQNFTWETFTFGGVHGSSYLKDVAIINENNIWAVGEIHTAETDQWNSDSTEWLTPYNAVHWDGNTWELKRILFPVDADQPNSYKSAKECRAIFVFNENDFLITASTQFAFMNSKGEYSIKTIGFKWEDRFTINALWGTSSEDFYVVGQRGNIAHYNGSSWKKIESGTELSINDIYGDYNSKTGKWEVLAVATDLQFNTSRVVLRIENKRVEKTETTSISQPLLSLWFKSNKKYYLVGSGIYTKNSLSEYRWERLSRTISIYFKYNIVAQNMNDIIVAGAFNEVLHFNGVSWKSYRAKELPFDSGRLMGANYTNNIICIVGQNGREGVIHIGKK